MSWSCAGAKEETQEDIDKTHMYLTVEKQNGVRVLISWAVLYDQSLLWPECKIILFWNTKLFSEWQDSGTELNWKHEACFDFVKLTGRGYNKVSAYHLWSENAKYC